MAIPYIGTVVLLPVAVFFRAYSLEYLSQYGREFTVSSPGDLSVAVEFDGDPAGYLPCTITIAPDRLPLICRGANA